MSLTETDTILIDPAAIEYISNKEIEEGTPLLKFQIIEYYFEWLSKQPPSYQMQFLREALRE